MRRAEQKEGSSRARLEEDLEEARERLDAERAAQRLAAERVEATTREVELLRADLAATRQNLDKAEADKTRVRCCQRISFRQQICLRRSFHQPQKCPAQVWPTYSALRISGDGWLHAIKLLLPQQVL